MISHNTKNNGCDLLDLSVKAVNPFQGVKFKKPTKVTLSARDGE